MKKIFIIMIAMSWTFARADSCFPLYEELRREIYDKHAQNDTRIVPALGQRQGRLIITGVKVPRIQSNWVDEFLSAIEDGPRRYGRDDDPRRTWLTSFARSIDKHCDLEDHDFRDLRQMLAILMDDGSFCPRGEVLNSKGKINAYTAILKSAVRSGKFSDYCQRR